MAVPALSTIISFIPNFNFPFMARIFLFLFIIGICIIIILTRQIMKTWGKTDKDINREKIIDEFLRVYPPKKTKEKTTWEKIKNFIYNCIWIKWDNE